MFIIEKSGIDQATSPPEETAGLNWTFLYASLIRYAQSPYLGDKEDAH